jgi:transposase
MSRAASWSWGRVPDGLDGVAQLHEMVAAHAGEPSEVVVGIEVDRGLLVGALVACGYAVHAVNPLSVGRYRDRHRTSGAKPDPGDAKVLADLVRTDRHLHREVAGDSERAEAVKVLARAHQSMIWSRQRHANQLRKRATGVLPRGPGSLRHGPGFLRRTGGAGSGADACAGSFPSRAADRHCSQA